MITMAGEQIGNGYGDLRNNAIALLVCHWMALSNRDGGNTGVAGNIKSEKEGDLSRSYGVNSPDSDRTGYLSQTSWGLELLRIRRKTIIKPITRMI
jgi:hypothetical protein